MIMIFSSKSQTEHCEFHYNNHTIKQTDAYSYLGIKLSKKAGFGDAVNLLKEKGNKAMFLLKSALYSGVTFQPSLPIKIFDSTIRPILGYASEVWCCDYSRILFKPHMIDKLPFEKVNNKFCKFIMGLPSQASNFAVKADLGKSPIFAFICSQAIRYWYRIINMDTNRTLKQAYLSELDIQKNGGNSWSMFIMKLLEVIGENKIWKNQNNSVFDKNEICLLKKKAFNNITKLYYTNQSEKIN